MGSKQASPNARYCTGSSSFVPSQALQDHTRHESVIQELCATNDLETAIRAWFSIDEGDDYVYHANTSVTLAQVQGIINRGGQGGLHSWYWTEKGGERQPLSPPPEADIESYISIFLPTTSTASALKSFSSNAKRLSIRSAVASHLLSKRFIHPSHLLATKLSSIPKTKSPTAIPCNPYLSFWAWSCHALQWCGPFPLPTPLPSPASSNPPTSPPSPEYSNKNLIMPPHKSHPLLAITMHHFSCAIPTHEALTILSLLSAGRPIADIGSGNGYWTAMLRQYGCSVTPVDSQQSSWRVNWLDDPTQSTIISDGADWLSSQDQDTPTAKSKRTKVVPQKGGKSHLLLIVYPIVGTSNGSFTRSLINSYAGDTVAVVGTQNHNGYTSFKDMTMDEYMEREHSNDGWKKIVQIPLPSFAGKDEALFVFQRGERVIGAATS